MYSDFVAATLEYPTLVSSDQKTPKVLVVDSDRHAVDYVRFFLGEAGYVTAHSPPGSEALQTARRTKPRLVIAEILTPELDGFSLCRRLKSVTDSELRVILVSSFDAQERAREAGADAFLRKPVSEMLLLNTVRGLLSSPWPSSKRTLGNGGGWNV